MWKLKSDTNALAPAYVYTNLETPSFRVIPDVEEVVLNDSSYQNNFIFNVKFIDFYKKLRSVKEQLEITFKPLKISNPVEDAELGSILTKNEFRSDVSSFFLTNALQEFNIFSNVDEELYLTYEIRISNISSFSDILNLLYLPIEEIYIDVKVPQPLTTKITRDFLEQISYTPSTSVILVVKQLVYSPNGASKVFCFDTLVSKYSIKSTSNNLSITPDTIKWTYQGVFRLIETTSGLMSGNFYMNRSNINFISSKDEIKSY